MKLIRRTWIYTLEIEDAQIFTDDPLEEPSLDDRFMKAYTQGDGEYVDEVVG